MQLTNIQFWIQGPHHETYSRVRRLSTPKENVINVKKEDGFLAAESSEHVVENVHHSTVESENEVNFYYIFIYKNRKAAGKDKVTREMIKVGGDRLVDWIWRLCNMAFRVVLCRKTRDLL